MRELGLVMRIGELGATEKMLEGIAQGTFIMEGGNAILIRLNDSAAAKSLYRQLPLTVQMEGYGGSEKIFYPPAELDTTDAPLAQGPAGTLAYYQPWGDVALFYGQCGGASGLYELGQAVSGAGHIADLAGEVRIETAVRKPGLDGELSAASVPQGRAPDVAAEEESKSLPQTQITVTAKSYTAALYENKAARPLIERLPLSLNFSELNGNEKYGFLPDRLPAKAVRPAGIYTGDLMLYGPDCLVLFYNSFSTSYSYTPLGKINDPAGLSDALGTGDVDVGFAVTA